MRHQSDIRDMSKGLLLGMVMGSAVGAAVALLFAPKSGKELRGDIAETTNEYKDKLGDAAEKAGRGAKVIVDDGVRRTKELFADARAKASQLVREAEEVLKQARPKKSISEFSESTSVDGHHN